MINIIKKELEFDDELKKKIEFICGFCNTAPKIINMTEDEFVEFIGKLWSMIVWGNKKYIADKIIELNGFNKIKKYLIDLLYGNNLIEKRWDDFYKNMKHQQLFE